MQNKLISHSLSALRIIFISSLTIFTIYSVQAWVSPTATAPNGNVAGPITTSGVAQTKAGDLTVNNLKLPAGGAIVTDPLATGNDKGMLNIFGQNSSLRAGLGFKDPVTSAFFGRIVSMDSGFYFLPGTDTSSSLIIGHGLIQTNGTTTTTNLRVTNGAAAGKVLTSDANGNATWTSSNGGGLGYGQTWQNMSGSSVGCVNVRSENINCTNSTGKPIFISVTFSVPDFAIGRLYVDNVNVASSMHSDYQANAPGYSTLTTIVPDGSVYYYSSGGNGGIVKWLELR